jgi:dimethylamine/trimethylamine dehydrogenase
MDASMAERLAEQGKQVSHVTFHVQNAPGMFQTGEGTHMYRRLHKLGVQMYPNHVVTNVKRGAIVGIHSYSDEIVAWPADSVVFVTERFSDVGLYRDLVDQPERLLDAGIKRVLRIGECLEPRVLADVIFDGHRLGREIDSPDPSRPLEFIREHRVIGKSDAEYDAVLTGRPGVVQPVSISTIPRRRP